MQRDGQGGASVGRVRGRQKIDGNVRGEDAAAQALAVFAARGVVLAVVFDRRRLMVGDVAGVAFVTGTLARLFRRGRHAAVMRHRNGCEKPVQAQHAGEQEIDGEAQQDSSAT